ncbi:iron complex transport system permease protein [Pseudonocardia sediminis]|uniref:Iron complex transport system permease protein n=1 Tax=Pseudonocardia sediminis TaxID=1397368 RepID=A0A4Q7UXT4_PSEST|nr:iron ABC transporter permease [Pseudonocardia sediminis]RZT86595.1 iron complex transport system permease protein [Pseudonocardia sediminis]
MLRSRYALLLGLVVCSAVLAVALLASVNFGTIRIGVTDVVRAFVDYDGSRDDLVIRTIRVPRALGAVLVGACLAVAGAIMQGLTRNPLADPGILGINAGAAFAVVTGVFVFGTPSSTYALVAFAGAAVAAALVYGIGSVGRGEMGPMRLAIVGAAVAALLSSFTTAMLILSQQTLDTIRFWLAGSLLGRDLELLHQIAPYACAGLLLALALSRRITALMLGDDVATGLGQRTGWTKSLAALAVVLLAGSAVAVAGPVGFIGLVVPHAVRFVVGLDYRWILPYSAVVGGIVLLAADIVSRVALRPQEIPVGVTTALIGAPFFIWLARSRVRQ